MEFQISWNDVRENKFHNLLGLRRIRKCRRLPFEPSNSAGQDPLERQAVKHPLRNRGDFHQQLIQCAKETWVMSA